MSEDAPADTEVLSISLTSDLKRRINRVCGENRSRFCRDAILDAVRRKENQQLDELKEARENDQTN